MFTVGEAERRRGEDRALLRFTWDARLLSEQDQRNPSEEGEGGDQYRCEAQRAERLLIEVGEPSEPAKTDVEATGYSDCCPRR